MAILANLCTAHCKKRFAIVPSPAGMSLTDSPGWDSEFPTGDGKIANFFYSVWRIVNIWSEMEFMKVPFAFRLQRPRVNGSFSLLRRVHVKISSPPPSPPLSRWKGGFQDQCRGNFLLLPKSDASKQSLAFFYLFTLCFGVFSEYTRYLLHGRIFMTNLKDKISTKLMRDYILAKKDKI